MNSKHLDFSRDAVRGLQRDVKTQHRVPLILSAYDLRNLAGCGGQDHAKPSWADPGLGGGGYVKVACLDESTQRIRAPWMVGDKLWVRERAWILERTRTALYDVDTYSEEVPSGPGRPRKGWTPMWASRFELELLDVQPQRIQDATEEDARSEGCEAVVINDAVLMPGSDHRFLQPRPPSYRKGLEQLHRDIWGLNSWTWVLKFRKTEHAR